jgi:integrase
MPKTDHLAILQAHEMRSIMDVARATGPLPFALTAWCYEFGARTAEPGLQLLKDVDMRIGRARPAHLKAGKPPAWHMLMPFCREAIPAWLAERGALELRPEQAPYLFPSRITTGRCYTCAGSGQRPVLKRQGKRRFTDSKIECHHCAGTGVRWGVARQEVYTIVSGVLKRSGVDRSCQHPHVLRHSIITHLLDAGVSDKAVQDRVGHKQLATTLEYARVTESALAEVEAKMSKVYG